MREFFWKHDVSIKSFFIVILLVLVMWIVSLQSQLTYVPATTPQAAPLVNDVCGKECRSAIEEIVSGSVATISALPKNTQVVQTTSKFQTTYIPLGSAFSTNKTDWAGGTSSDFYLVKEDYGSNAYFSWEPSIKVGYGGGKVSARIFDVTNGIAVDGSEVSTTSQSSTQISSGALNFWSGRNLYRVQIKSLNEWDVFYDSGRLKAYYK